MKNQTHLENKVCLVTGANSGIGKEVAKQFLELGAQVIMVARSQEKGQIALDEIKTQTGKSTVELMICDFASQESIRSFADSFLEKYDRLDILVNNHGAMNRKKMMTPNDLEMTFAVNHLGYFLLTNLLLDTLKSSPARIINVASGAYAATRKSRLSDYNFKKRRYSGFKAYSESKLYNLLFTFYLAKKLTDNGITVNTLSPGFVKTNFGNSYRYMKFFKKLISKIATPVEEAAMRIIYLATSPEVEAITGKYFIKNRVEETTSLSLDENLQEELWELSSKLTGLSKE
jgi:NAD(P)-dependent dehydrogenase (short-subunit alcohol dehydrogenase family)